MRDHHVGLNDMLWLPANIDKVASVVVLNNNTALLVTFSDASIRHLWVI